MGVLRRNREGSPVGFELRVLGGVALQDASGEDAGVPRGKPMAMVCYLAMNPDGAERDYLARLLWSSGDAAKGRHSVRQALSRVRQALGAEALIGSDPIRLLPGLITVDVKVLRGAVVSGEIDRALEVWGGEPFAGLSISDEPGWTAWVGQVRAETHALLAAGLEDAAAAAVGRGAPEEAIRYLARATEALPGRAEAWARLIEVQTDFGRLRDARTSLAAAWAALDADTYEARLGDLERRVSLGGDPSTAQSEEDLMGREADLAAVAEAWRNCLEGRTSVLVFQADAGGGKTRMMRESEAPLVTPGAHVIHIECRSQQGGTAEPWRAVREVIQRLSALPGAETALPGSADRLSDLEQLPIEELVHPFLDLFASVCRSTPVLLTLDDLEWIDLESWALLQRLIRLRPASAILIVASLTATGGGEGTPARDVSTWWDKGWVTMRSLRPLSAAEIEAAVRLRGWQDDGFVSSLRDVLHMRSEGSPAAVFGLLDSMAAAGVRPTPPGSPGAPPPELPHLDDLPFSDGLLRFHRGRLARLGATAAEVLSVVGPVDEVRLETLSLAANSEPDAVRGVLSELEAAHFVISSSDGYRLVHPDYAKLGKEARPIPSGPPQRSDPPALSAPPISSKPSQPPAPSVSPAPWTPPVPPPRSSPPAASTPSAPTAPPTPTTSRPSLATPPSDSTPAPESKPTPSPVSPESEPAAPGRLSDPSNWLGPASGGSTSSAPSPLRPLVRSPSVDIGLDAPVRPQGRSIFPAGWSPQPPAYIAAALLIGIIWIVWRVIT